MFQHLLQNKIHSSIEDLIRQNVQFGKRTHSGFHELKCPKCTAKKMTKRAGFKFDDGTIIYNCFNSKDCNTVYTEFSGRMSSKFRDLMDCFGIDEREVSLTVKFTANGKQKTSETVYNTFSETLPLPTEWVELSDTDPACEAVYQYAIKRDIVRLNHKLYYAKTGPLVGKLIIPFYDGNRLIYWQARDIADDGAKKYISPALTSESIFFDKHKLTENSKSKLLVCEGAIDAMFCQGIAVMGGSPSPTKKAMLKQSNRHLVFVLDRDPNGKSLGEWATSEGFAVAFPPTDCVDVAKSVEKHGLIYTMATILGSEVSGVEASVAVKLMKMPAK